jgi:hypothetical protein
MHLEKIDVLGKHVLKHYEQDSRELIKTPIIKIRYHIPFPIDSLILSKDIRWKVFKAVVLNNGVTFTVPGEGIVNGRVHKLYGIQSDPFFIASKDLIQGVEYNSMVKMDIQLESIKLDESIACIKNG